MTAPLEQVTRLSQRCLESAPVLVVGSGASAKYGLPDMKALADSLVQRVIPRGECDVQAWNRIQELLKARDLESALYEVDPSDDLLSEITSQVRSIIEAADLKVLAKVVENPATLDMTGLFRHLFDSTQRDIAVVTTNYDRLIEYAANAAQYRFYTGFDGGYFGRLATSPCCGGSARTVKVWKVHGSVDWFKTQSGMIMSLTTPVDTGSGLIPLIVSPGRRKYEVAFQDPFRTIVTNADTSLVGAQGYLCIGYGFNDQHIQLKLREKVYADGRLIVILTKRLTPAAKEFLNSGATNYLALEESDDGTRAYMYDHPDGVNIPEVKLWDLGAFLANATR